MEAVGLLRAEVLPAATSRAAAVGRAGLTGVLAPGFEGDLIAAADDPNHDLTVLHDLRLLVVFRGRSPRASRVYCAYFLLRGTE